MSYSLRSIRSRLAHHDRYLDPFPADVEAAFATLCDALDSEQQRVKVAALAALFHKGLACAESDLGQADFGHRVLLFLMKIKGRVLDSRVDEVFMRSFMRLVRSKQARDVDMQREVDRVKTMLREYDEATEDGRWWRQAMSYSSGDDLSEWSGDDDDDDDTDDEDGDAQVGVVYRADAKEEACPRESMPRDEAPRASSYQQRFNQTERLVMVRDLSSPSLTQHHLYREQGRQQPYQDPCQNA
jgi:hypothetical protein